MIRFIFKPHSLLYCLEKSKSRSIIAWITAWWFWPVRRGIRWDQSPCFEFKRRVFHQKLLEFSALPSENRATPFHPVVCLNPHVYPMFFGAMVLNPPSFQVFQPAAPRAVQPPLQHLPRCWRSNAKGRRWLFWSCDNGWSWGRQGHPKGDQKRRKPRDTKGHQGPPRATKGHQGGSRYGVLGKSLNIGGMGLIWKSTQSAFISFPS